ncbi:hypothetical protein [Pseudomonas sp. Irchel 3A7]|jgi:hypothetical protein|uniref:hypothetical protein n=1 Tax=Pseudomonas sp. Irchel 3A7 TaxID=2008913 RepID=UPI000BA49720|nr:hypothetical protein [Pseudomonas sp. Irchel 3A7]
MRKITVISVCAMWMALFSMNSSACDLTTGQCAAAKVVAESIMSALPAEMTAPKAGCNNANPFLITGGDDRIISSAINSAVRQRRGSITIKLSPAVPLSQFPVSVADALNRVQLSGGSVKEQKDTGQQSAGALLAWGGAQLGALVTYAVNALLNALADQWVTDNYKGYDAVLLFRPSEHQGNIYNEVKFSCKQ